MRRDQPAVLTRSRGVVTNESDIEALYEERAQVVLALARAAKALGLHTGFATDPEEPLWPVLFVDLPTGQVSWHFTMEQRGEAADIGDYEGIWDGHSTPEKYARLAAWRPERRKHASRRRTSRRRT